MILIRFAKGTVELVLDILTFIGDVRRMRAYECESDRVRKARDSHPSA